MNICTINFENCFYSVMKLIFSLLIKYKNFRTLAIKIDMRKFIYNL